jgi:hypothetical protein
MGYYVIRGKVEGRDKDGKAIVWGLGERVAGGKKENDPLVAVGAVEFRPDKGEPEDAGQYAGMSKRDLFALCKERGLPATILLGKLALTELLEADDAARAAGDDDADGEGDKVD